MKKFLVILGIVSVTMTLSSCFHPAFWDEPYPPHRHGHYYRRPAPRPHAPIHAVPRYYY